ncbi:MAG: Snf7 family protein [Thaumarchaeota archaeon]|nr:Snf7 family protein [Nitrososphaerota archaeon]
MTKFSKMWSGESAEPSKPRFTNRFLNRVNPPPSLKETLEKAERTIRNQLYKLDMVLAKLNDKDKKLLQQIERTIQKRDNGHATILANELVEIRKMTRMVAQARYALEAIALRLETARDLGDIVVTLAPAVAAIKNIQGGVAGIIPTAEDNFTEIGGLLSDILVNAGQNGETKLDFNIANQDAEKILAEASALAEESLREKIPSVPAGIPKSISSIFQEEELT